MKPHVLGILALCSASTTTAAAVEVRQLLGGVIGGVTSLLGGGGAATTTSSTRATSTSSSTPRTTTTSSVVVSATVGVSVSVPTTNLVSATVGLSLAPIYTSNAGVSATIAVCLPGVTPLLDVPALVGTLGEITTALDKAANPVVASNPLLGILSPLVPTTLGATQLLADIATANTLVNVNALGILVGVTAGGGCLSVEAQLSICQLLDQLLHSLEVLLTRVMNTCNNALGSMCSSLLIGTVLQQLYTLEQTIINLVATLVSLGLLPTCQQRMVARQADVRQTLAGTIVTLNNLPNVVTTNIGNQLVTGLGFTGVNDPLFKSLSGYPNRRRRRRMTMKRSCDDERDLLA